MIKTVFHYNLGKHHDELLKVLETGHLHSKTQHEKVLPREEVSRGDINNFYQYVRNLITHLPRSSSNLTKRQTRILNLLKQERALWLAEINQRQQDRQMQSNVVPKAKLSKQDNARANEDGLHKERLHKERPELIMADSSKSAASELSVVSMGAQGACKQGQTKTCSGGGGGDRGQEFNDFYGALNAKELSLLGLSMSKVIDKALHKKTKPGMAILVSEALLQRGVESVPPAFVSMFAKVKRMAQSELPFT